MSPPDQLTLSILADLSPRGDGTYILRPRRPSPGDEWVDALTAARLLGVSRPTIYRLADEGAIRHRRLRTRRQFHRSTLMDYASSAEES